MKNKSFLFRPSEFFQRHTSKSYQHLFITILYQQQTFIPISIGERSANGTSLVFNSHNKTPKLHISAALIFKSDGEYFSAAKKKQIINQF